MAERKKYLLYECRWIGKNFVHGQLWWPYQQTGVQRSCGGNKLSNSENNGKRNGFDSTTWFVCHLKNVGCVEIILIQVKYVTDNRGGGGYFNINKT